MSCYISIYPVICFSMTFQESCTCYRCSAISVWSLLVSDFVLTNNQSNIICQLYHVTSLFIIWHFRKAVHATVVLLPLFGLHWLLTLYRPQADANCVGKTFYKYLNVILDGLQGLMVSIAFCYRNGEVRLNLHRESNVIECSNKH